MKMSVDIHDMGQDLMKRLLSLSITQNAGRINRIRYQDVC